MTPSKITPWVDYKLVKETVGIERVLQHYGIRLKPSGTNLRGPCPLPQHGTEKHKSTQSFMVNPRKGIGGVWACESTSCIAARDGAKGGNCIDFVKWMENVNFKQAALQIQEWFGLHPTRPSDNGPHHVPATVRPASAIADGSPKPGELASKKRELPEENHEPNKPLKFTLQGVDPTHPYLAQRGISEETARTFGVGFFPGKGSMAGRVVIPIHNLAGELVAYAGRALEDTSDKYKFPPGFHKSLELWNAHRVLAQTWPDELAELVVVVEGFFDCMRLWQAGIPAVALMGSSLSDTQAEIISTQWYETVLIFDGDAAGRSCTDQALAKLRCSMWARAVLLGDGEQPDKFTTDEIRNLLDSIL